jgi:hypothetical protein
MDPLVVPEIDPFVRSLAETVCVPTVFNVTVNWRNPFERTPDVGFATYEFVAVTWTLSPLGTGLK